MPLVTCRVSDGLPFVIAVLNAAAIILYYLTNHWGHVRRCAISDRRSVRSIRSVGTAVRREPEHGDSMDFENWLKTLADEGGSDLYLTTGAPPSAKFDGELKSLSDERLSPGFTRDLAYELMDGQQAREFDEKLEMNLAISLSGIGRFRVNIFKQRNEVGMVVR